MPDPRLRPDDLRGRRWREDLHEHITPVQVVVDPLVEEAAREVGRRRAEEVTSARLPLDLVAEVVNQLDAEDLHDPLRLLLCQPNMLVVSLQQAHSEGTPDADDPAAHVELVTGLVADRAYPDFVDELVDLALRPEVLDPLVRQHGLQAGAVPREELVERLRSEGVDVREGRFVEQLARVLGEVAGGDRGGDEAGVRTAVPVAPMPDEREEPDEMAQPDRIEQTVPHDRGTTPRAKDACPPPVLWNVDCRLSVPGRRVASQPRGDLLVLPPTISFLYQFSERQPLFAAMETLRERALGSDLFNPVAVSEEDSGEPRVAGEGAGDSDELCDLRLVSYSWNNEVDPLTLRRRADVAAVIGVRDPAATSVVNAEFARAADQLIDVLAATAMDSRRYGLEWARAVATELSLQLAGSLQTALTGGVLVDVALWRRQFDLASRMFQSRVLRGLLGVGLDPDTSPAPAIRRVLPSARFDAASLYREWRSLELVLRLARRLATGQTVDDGEFTRPAAAAVTLRALRGRLGVPSDRTTSR